MSYYGMQVIDAAKNADLASAKAAVAGGVDAVKGAIDAALGLWGDFDKDGVSL